ncbi:MAG: thermopsin, partial [Thermoplasmata archaeon]|nr:thermopsin [Thermoplasmata archaeon]
MQRWSTFRVATAVLLGLLMLSSSFAILGSSASIVTGNSPHAPPSSGTVASSPRPTLAPSAASPPLSADAQRMLSITRGLHARGVPAGAIHLPNLAAESANHVGVVSSLYAQAPAPMGVADIGIHNVSGVL